MPSIPQRLAGNLFQTVLTGDDKAMLQRIVRHQVDAMNNALEQSDYPAADRCWSLLNQLRIIEHSEIDECIERQVRPHMHVYVEKCAATFSRHAAQHDFTGAENLLESLRSLQTYFPDENLVDLVSLEATLQTARAQYTAQQRAEEERQRAEEARQKAKEARQRAEEERQRERRKREDMEARLRIRQEELEEARRRRGPGVGVQIKVEIPCTIS